MLSWAALGSGQTLEGIAKVEPSLRSHRASTWDRTGGNGDAIMSFAPGQTHVVLETKSPGRINHIWMTASHFPGHDTYLRDLVIRMYWDGSNVPSVEVPAGDFFGLSFARTYAFESLPVAVGENPAAMNCYWPMPFRAGARVELYNNGPRTIRSIYYHVDYETGPQEKRAGFFHAAYRRDAHIQGQAQAIPNLSGKDNFTLLETEGTGQYVGCFLYVDSKPGGWWGEGDDMIFIDHSEMPVINGTGSEDYFNNAWGLGRAFSYPFYGCPLLEKQPDGNLLTTVYRWHIPDPVRFRKHIRVTIEHTWDPSVTNDFSCVAFWYQTKPNSHRAPLPKLRSDWPQEHHSRQQVATELELNATMLEEGLRAEGIKVSARTARSPVSGLLQIEPGDQPVRIPVPVGGSGAYSVQVRPYTEGFEGEAKMAVEGEMMRTIQSTADKSALQQPWIPLGIANATDGQILLKASGRSLGLQALKLEPQR